MLFFLVIRAQFVVEVVRLWIANQMIGYFYITRVMEVTLFSACQTRHSFLPIILSIFCKRNMNPGTTKEWLSMLKHVTTSANAKENSLGTYCPGQDPAPPHKYHTCLGDLYSVSWMEHSESHNLKLETIEQQYQTVKEKTSNNHTYSPGSHVMEYGTKRIKYEELYLYQGFDSSTAVSENNLPESTLTSISQEDDLIFMLKMYEQLDDSSKINVEGLKEITETMKHRLHLDDSFDFIGKLIFGSTEGPSILGDVRPSGQSPVDDWDCLKSVVRIFESYCGILTFYGLKHMEAFVNICNRGISMQAMKAACISVCGGYNSVKWSPLSHGYSV